jgi:hypothetical protein
MKRLRSVHDRKRLAALLLFVPVAGDAATSTTALSRSARRPRSSRSKRMEETMTILTINELLRLTKGELLELHSFFTNQLAELPEGSAERHDTLATLANVRAILARPEITPRRGVIKAPTP